MNKKLKDFVSTFKKPKKETKYVNSWEQRLAKRLVLNTQKDKL